MSEYPALQPVDEADGDPVAGRVVSDEGAAHSAASDGGYRDLIAWQKAMNLVTEVYRLTETWPKHESFGLTRQVQRAAVSVPSNIAEGKGRHGAREFAHHLSIAHGSLCELETQIEIARRLGYLPPPSVIPLEGHIAEVGQLIRGVLRRLNA